MSGFGKRHVHRSPVQMRRRRGDRPWTTLLTVPGLALAALVGCGEAEPDGPIRLVDELAQASIETPLAGLEPWATLEDRLEDQLFWRFKPRKGRKDDRSCRRIGEFRILCDGGTANRYSAAFRVPTKAYSSYRVRARVRSSDRQCGRMRISDTRDLRVLSVPEQKNAWQEVSESWHTGGIDDELRIEFRGGCELLIEELEVRQVLLDAAAELSALAAESPSPFSSLDLGMEKYGSLLPHEEAETIGKPFDENWGFREAILAPAPTEIRYSVQVPKRGRLRFSYALADKSRLGDQARFEVVVGSGGGARTVWSEELVLTEENWHWHEAMIDLAPFAGRQIDLALRTTSQGERGYALWGTPTIDRPRRAEEPPNIIFIAVDTLRADRLSAYGYSQPTSPQLDALADDGILFLNPISQSTQTPPAFASLFTGQIVARHDFIFAASDLPTSVPLLARVLRQNGWTTHAAMFHPALYDLNLARGFERFFNLPRTEQRADQNLQKGLEFLAANEDRRFFFFLHFSDPHQPFTQPDEFVQQETAAALRDFDVELPFSLRGTIGRCEPCTAEEGVSDEFKQVVRALYDEEVNYVDDQIGIFLQDLKDRGLYENSIIVFTSDHGETLWDHFDYFEHGGVNQHDELTRVPLIIKPPAGRGYAAGRVVKDQVRSFDLMPTLLEMTGLETDLLDLDAESLVPLLLEEPGEARYEGEWAYTSNERAASVRGGGWKWTWARRVGEGLFHLAEDPLEQNNVADDHPNVLRGMRSRYMETQLSAVGGRYLLILGDGDRELNYQVRVRARGARRWRSKLVDAVGLDLAQSDNPEVLLYRGNALRDRLVLFAKLPPTGEEPTVEMVTAEGPLVRAEMAPVEAQRVAWSEGELSRLLASGSAGVYLIEAPLRSAAASSDPNQSSLDATHEQALRALGYIQ